VFETYLVFGCLTFILVQTQSSAIYSTKVVLSVYSKMCWRRRGYHRWFQNVKCAYLFTWISRTMLITNMLRLHWVRYIRLLSDSY